MPDPMERARLALGPNFVLAQVADPAACGLLSSAIAPAVLAHDRNGRPVAAVALPAGHGEPIVCVRLCDFAEAVRAYVGVWKGQRVAIHKALDGKVPAEDDKFDF